MQTITSPLIGDEPARLDVLRSYNFKDLDNDQTFCELTQLASRLCSAPVAFLSLIDEDGFRYKARTGLETLDSAREDPLCSLAAINPGPFVINDFAEDERFAGNPFVSFMPGARFYAGAPLVTPEGLAIGVLAVMDSKPRELDSQQLGTLATLARAAMDHLNYRRASLELERVLTEQQSLEEILQTTDQLLDRLKEQNSALTKFNTMLKEKFAEHKIAFDAVVSSQERYSLVVRSANQGLWDWDLRTNKIYFCPRWAEMLGHEEAEIGNSPDGWLNRVHPEDLEAVHAEMVAHLLGLTPGFHSEHRLRHKDGQYRWMLSRGLAVRDGTGMVYRMAGSLSDTTPQREAEKQLLHNAYHDVLTGLPNRALFMDRLNRSLGRARHRDGYLFAVLFLDLDRFKVINDSLGHPVGDDLLVALARRLEGCLRPGDMVARLGGDEFAIILDHLKHIKDAIQAAERIQKELSMPFNLNGHEVFASASIGITTSLIPYEAPEDFLRNADTAMYRAKEQGRGCFELFDTGMHETALAVMQLENDLRRAFTRDEFKVYYQPIISLENWHIAGFEALLRWPHPEQGFISPMKFIPVAEETGLIIPIGYWVLREACEQLRVWQQQFPSTPPLSISVNLSGKQFGQPDLIEQIKKILDETGIRPGTLKLEITESAIIDNTETAASMLKQIKSLGIKVSLDDFGTGYSSLSYLHRFPIDTLKVDRSFVTRMNLPKNSEIVRTIVTLASNLGMDVIAEGVESGEQIVQLSGMNCEYVQGYLFSQPIDSEAAQRLLEETHQKGLGQPGMAI
ncbi:MAG TPA: EAL domain-containing protein [Blastocatellia bacterium]|nr:EAL domain-containing protein [Blastocatellia bacterium]